MRQDDFDNLDGGPEEAIGKGCLAISVVLVAGFLFWRISVVGVQATLKGVSDFIVGTLGVVFRTLGDVEFMRSTAGIMVTGTLILIGSILVFLLATATGKKAYPTLAKSYYAIYLARGFDEDAARDKAFSAARNYLWATYLGLGVLGSIWLAIWLKFIF